MFVIVPFKINIKENYSDYGDYECFEDYYRRKLVFDRTG